MKNTKGVFKELIPIDPERFEKDESYKQGVIDGIKMWSMAMAFIMGMNMRVKK